MTIRKYITIASLSLKEYFVYRLNFVLWRLRNVFTLILTYFLWNSVYVNKSVLFAYTKEEMVTYVLIVSIVSAIILSGRTADLAGEILNGSIMNYLLKPFNFIWGIVVREIADKSLNFTFSVIEVLLLIAAFKPEIIVSNAMATYFAVFSVLVIGAVISFFISFCLSMLAFWTPEVWGPRFILMILSTFLSGIFYPIDVFPPTIYKMLMITPFPYMAYIPAKVYLEGASFLTLDIVVIGLLWCIVLYSIASGIWNKGIKEFSFYGK